MRTISKNLKKRLIAQAEEASFNGFDKVASDIQKQVSDVETREDLEEYIYSRTSLEKDIEDLFWKAAIRMQDYFGKSGDAKDIADVIAEYKDDFISSVKTKIGGELIGPYEPSVPGENRRFSVEIDED